MTPPWIAVVLFYALLRASVVLSLSKSIYTVYTVCLTIGREWQQKCWPESWSSWSWQSDWQCWRCNDICLWHACLHGNPGISWGYHIWKLPLKKNVCFRALPKVGRRAKSSLNILPFLPSDWIPLAPQCTMCTLFSIFSAQPNKLRPLRQFVFWYPI